MVGGGGEYGGGGCMIRVGGGGERWRVVGRKREGGDVKRGER